MTLEQAKVWIKQKSLEGVIPPPMSVPVPARPKPVDKSEVIQGRKSSLEGPATGTRSLSQRVAEIEEATKQLAEEFPVGVLERLDAIEASLARIEEELYG